MTALNQPIDSAIPVDRTPVRWRRIASIALLVIFFVTAMLSTVSVWMRNQIVDTDRYVRTVEPLASNPAIQNAIAVKISTSLGDRLSTTMTTSDILPEGLQPFTPALASAVVDFVHDTVLEVVASDQFAQYWEEANRAVHAPVSALLTGGSTERLSSQNGEVSIDLAPLVTRVTDRLRDRGIEAVDRIELTPEQTTFVLIDSADLRRVQDIVNVLEALAIVLPIVALAAIGGYIGLAYDRRQAVIRAGFALAGAMAVMLLLLALGRWYYLREIGPERDSAAASAIFDTFFHYFRRGVRLLAVIGLVVSGVAYVTRPRGQQSVRVWLTTTWKQTRTRWPWITTGTNWIANHRGVMWGAIAVLCSLILVWGDRVTLGRALIAAALIALGYVGLRFVSRRAATHQSALEPAAESLVVADDIGMNDSGPVAPPASPLVAPLIAASAASPSTLTISLELPEEDVKLVRRLAVMLRETPAS